MTRPLARLCLLVVAAHALLYWRTVTIGYVTDDFLWLEAVARADGAGELLSGREPFGYLRPVFRALVAAARATSGLDAVPLHALALAASVAAATLLGAWLWRRTCSGLAAAAGALWFTVHPSNAIALSWVSSLPSLLVAAFGLGAVVTWCRFRERGRTLDALASLLLHALALASKEEAVVVALWLVLADRGQAFAGRARQGARRGYVAAHVALVVAFVVAWSLVGGGGEAPFGPRGAGDWLGATGDAFARLPALWLPRHAIGGLWAAALLVALATWAVRRRVVDGRALLVAVLACAVALVPSSVGLHGFRWDKLDRLLHPALPTAALAVALVVAGVAVRSRTSRTSVYVGAALFVALLAVFAARSSKTVGRRAVDGGHARALVAALAPHAAALRAAAAAGTPVLLVGYEVGWSRERDWIYPTGPARALAPGVDVRALASRSATGTAGALILSWDPAARRFRRG